MSKGEIVGHIADGKYRVRQKLAVEKIKIGGFEVLRWNREF